MTSIEIDPRWLEFGGPALLVGIVLGALLVWLVARNKRLRLESENEDLRDKIKNQEALQSEREAAFQAASAQIVRSFGDLANRSLQSNSENFLRLAEQKMSVQNEQAKRALSEREQAVENLVKPIREALQSSQRQIEALEKSRSEAYGSIRTQLEAMHIAQTSLTKETHNLAKALRRPEVRGRWGEITLRRLVELAGMVEIYTSFPTRRSSDLPGYPARHDRAHAGSTRAGRGRQDAARCVHAGGRGGGRRAAQAWARAPRKELAGPHPHAVVESLLGPVR